VKQPIRTAICALSLLFAAGCASVPRDPAARAEFKANDDPLEPLNRRIFAFNRAADRVVIKPLAEEYRRRLAQPARDAIRHFLDNLSEPDVLANCILQGRPKSAATAGGRFVVNSTVGLAGLFDVAAVWKLPRQQGDFGQTLWSWGVAEGPYLVIPVFGPKSPRDGIGQGVDVFFDPFIYIFRDVYIPSGFKAGRLVLDGVDQRERNLESLDALERESIDYYASLRSLYRQTRAAELRGGNPSATLPAPDFYEDPGR
jgi:phospholipid-binding lipoprotein MlaA